MIHKLNRREALRKLATGGVAAATSDWWVAGLASLARDHASAGRARQTPADGWTPRVFDAHQDEAVIALSERIIPETDTPGAKQALVNRFIDGVLADATEADRARFADGLADLDRRSRVRAGADFAGAPVEQQIAILTEIESAGPASPSDAAAVEFFQAVKALTITGYYGTEIGLQQELGDDGRMFLAEFVGCTHPEHQA